MNVSSPIVVPSSPAAAVLPLYTRDARSASPQQMSPVDGFFGYAFAVSRHQDSSGLSAEALPAYGENVLPEYKAKDEPVTLAMYLFKFGFLFFPFWIMGALIMMSPLRAMPDGNPSTAWLPEKTDAEKQAFVDHMRKAELRWARRCLVALGVLACVAAGVGVTMWATMRRE